MNRQAEPEIMNGYRQVCAYAEADFSIPNQMFVDLFKENFPELSTGKILDLGCGPADIPLRFARHYPQCSVVGVDGADRMLEFGRKNIAAQGLDKRVKLIHGSLPHVDLPKNHFSTIISNSLLHHLHDPLVLWQAISFCGKKNAAVLVMDLFRPSSTTAAARIVSKYASSEPKILQDDFYNSLLAAYSPSEVREQLERAGLNNLKVSLISDRHFIVVGYLKKQQYD
jgi:ubiquinone/menaquinone biosynthesis C-methylase UbiE